MEAAAFPRATSSILDLGCFLHVHTLRDVPHSTFPIQGRILEWGPHELLSKSTIETATGSRNDRLICHVQAKLLVCMTLARFRRNNELANSLMDTRDDTGDVELRGQGFVIKAHSNVLTLRSAPLKAKFDRWDKGRPFVFTLDESVTEEVARSVLDYLYTLKVPKIDGFANKRPLFALADQLGQNKLIEDWAAGMELDGEELEEIMLWPEIEQSEGTCGTEGSGAVQGGPQRAWDGAWTGGLACCEGAEGVQ
jgi:hypothetical protein